MNFVRGCEPRDPQMDLLLPVQKELELCQEYGYENTFLLQYDAMEREDIMRYLKENSDDTTEFGIWIEMARSLVERVGIEWRGREGYDWDWYVNPGFLSAYTQQQRRDIIDEIMRKFYEHFGYYPKSVGSWMLDAYAMDYMSEKYGVLAFCICREQYGIDAYSYVGGYYNQGYYPSKYNQICPAQTTENQINTPVFRLLGPDPVYNYGLDMYEGQKGWCPTIEPVSDNGSDDKVIDWFYHNYFDNESLAFSYMQLGQENPFGWELIKKGLPKQLEKLKNYVDSGKCKVMKMCDTGKWFKENFKMTPATALISDSDPQGKDFDNSIWYNCINYRANLVSEGNKLYFRDIYKFCETYREEYYDKPCEKWSAYYDNLPVMDGFLWRRDDTNRAGIYFDDAFKSLKTYKSDDRLVTDIEFVNSTVKVIFSENSIEIYTDKALNIMKNDDIIITYENECLCYTHNGCDYNIGLKGKYFQNVIEPVNGEIIFYLKKA